MLINVCGGWDHFSWVGVKAVNGVTLQCVSDRSWYSIVAKQLSCKEVPGLNFTSFMSSLGGLRQGPLKLYPPPAIWE